MDNRLVKKVVVVNESELPTSQLSEKVAFFKEDGSSIDFDAFSSGGSSLTPGDTFSVDASVTATTSKFGDFDISGFTVDDGEWFDGAEENLVLPAGFYNVTFKNDASITGALTDLWVASLVNVITGDIIVSAKSEVYNEAYRIGNTQLIHLPEVTTGVLQWSRVGITSGNFSVAFQMVNMGYDLV